MNRCTEPSMRGWTFARSSCTRGAGLRSIIILCHDHHSGLRAAGQSCANNEFCIDTGYTATEAKAYCVSSDNFFAVPRSEPQRGITTRNTPGLGALHRLLRAPSPAAAARDGSPESEARDLA
ncbi:MAG: hypothetical protein Q9195_005186 [Heterodermia aff. obscurata]